MLEKGVLIVEDDVDIREMLAEVLKDDGFNVVTAANGQEAIDCLHQERRPCLIPLDLMMPVMNGWQFRKLQKQDPSLSRIPVVVITAGSTGGSTQNGVDPIDADGFFRKPIDLDTLLNTVEQYCCL